MFDRQRDLRSDDQVVLGYDREAIENLEASIWHSIFLCLNKEEWTALSPSVDLNVDDVGIDALRCVLNELGPLGFVELFDAAEGATPSVEVFSAAENCEIDLESLLPKQTRPEPAPTATPQAQPVPTAVPPAPTAVPAATPAPAATQAPFEKAPDFELPFYRNRAGEPGLRLSDLSGTPVVLNFWFAGCPPCRPTMSAIETVYKSGRWAEVLFLGIQIPLGTEQLDPDRGQAFAEEIGVSYALVFDAEEEVSRNYGIAGVPTTIVLDSYHNIVGRWAGVLDGNVLENLIRQIASPSPTPIPTPEPTSTPTPEPPVTESERLVSRLSAAFAEDGDLNDFEKAYLRRIGGASTPELALALSSSPLTEDATVTELEIDILKKIECYHPRLQAAIVSHAPQSAAPFLSGSVLSDQEAEALSALHSVFGIEAFYDAWQLDWLEINEIQAVLRLLQSYDPFSTVYGPTENTDSQDGLIERTFDQFSVGPAGSCVYCQGQKYFTSGSPTKDYRTSGYSPEEYLEYSKAVTQDVVVRTRLLHLVHAATVQFWRLSPCDLRDYSKPELLIMAPNAMGFFDPLYDYSSYYGPIAYFINATTFMHSVKVDEQILASVAEPVLDDGSDKGVLRLTVGDLLSPFTTATKIVAQGGPVERSRTGCLEAAKRIVDWDRYRYGHFGGSPEQALSPFAEKVFPENPRFFPMWVMLLTNESGGQDKAQRLVGMMRSLNVPAGRLGNDVFPEVDHPDPDKGVHGGYFDDVLLPAWNVTLERNIGFGYKDKFTPIDHLFCKYDPGCRIQADPYVAEHFRFAAAIFSCDSSVVHRPLDQTFVDNLASNIDRLFKSAIEAATDSDVEADPIKVGGTQSCFSGSVVYSHPGAFALRLMKDELAELLRKEEAILEEVREDLYYLTVDLLGRTTTASILSTGNIHVIFSYCE